MCQGGTGGVDDGSMDSFVDGVFLRLVWGGGNDVDAKLGILSMHCTG